ncbi:bis-aminopropyl spermidine synthase family protein [Sphaerisporangium sp. TRM90804]|uniref:bis-aminopropyl spermidine synthase family protein n=1 Tax=Sphaerisporangium sp. TRM90804 TaxID=3031113 RepID=UPI00244B8876|nr:bis-aminopropyl spermidine synthase family protein [Sphaerisporangium sp. TRM90804]MDH2427337.1 bis-aminopropyl spermidine synthase family protein [Sphaerisporangium sp. TRM90804]
MDQDFVKRLSAAGGMDARRVHAALTLLCDGEWWTLADLVRATAAPRRAVEGLLREVAPERSGERFRLPPGRAGEFRGPLGAGHRPFTPADPVEHLLPAHAEVVQRLTRLIAEAPRGRHALDHVAATPETVVRRALLLGARFWTPGSRVLCVGDHDLTSLAVALIHPGAEVAVADVDERILAYIDARSGELGLNVRTRWADLRLGLPASLREYADLAVTDPPYTPEGVGLFVARAVEGLRDPEQGRVLLAYGASERTPMLALKVQNSLHDLNLAYEAMYPDFNRYLGAEAIGSAADLYVLRPTSKTRPAVAARVERFGAAIYTQGPQAVESRPGGGVDDAALQAETAAFAPGLLVGDWPAALLPKAPRVRLATWLAKPYATSPGRVAIAVPAGLEASLPRLLLAARAGHVRALLAGQPADAALPEPVRVVYDVTVKGNVLDAVRRPPAADDEGRVLRRLLDRAHGKIANTWRESLIEVHGELTRNQAREAVTRAAPWAEGVTLLELPAHRLDSLRAAVGASLRLASGR